MTKFYLALSQMRERGEVPAGADGPLLRDPGEAGGVEGVDELPQGARGDAGVALGQHVDAQGQQHPESESSAMGKLGPQMDCLFIVLRADLLA